jgi:hypothetical protein
MAHLAVPVLLTPPAGQNSPTSLQNLDAERAAAGAREDGGSVSVHAHFERDEVTSAFETLFSLLALGCHSSYVHVQVPLQGAG